MVSLRIEAAPLAERAIARQLERYGCRVEEESPTRLRVEFPDATSERDALVETRLYLGAWMGSVLSAQAA